MAMNVKDTASGSVFIVIGVLTCIYAATELQLGSALRMGPGYFPLVLGILMAVLGAAILWSGRSTPTTMDLRAIPWRAAILITLAPIIFAVTVTPLGLVSSTFLACLAASLAGGFKRLGSLLLVAASITVFCLLVFSYGLDVSMPLVGPWLQ